MEDEFVTTHTHSHTHTRTHTHTHTHTHTNASLDGCCTSLSGLFELYYWSHLPPDSRYRTRRMCPDHGLMLSNTKASDVFAFVEMDRRVFAMERQRLWGSPRHLDPGNTHLDAGYLH